MTELVSLTNHLAQGARVASTGDNASTNPEARKLSSYPLFDWLRFILASIVALAHAKVIGGGETTANLAVQVFFALSGWLIGGILLQTLRAELPRFFFNRATRIWLPYFFAILALYALSALRDPLSLRWLEFLFYDVTFTHNWFSLRPDPLLAFAQMPLNGTGNHFWSIAVEEQFYLLAPLIIVVIGFGRKPIFWVIAVLFLFAFHVVDFPSICLGVFAAILKQKYGDWHLRPRAILGLGVAAVLSFVVLINIAYYSFAAPVFSVVIVLIAARPGPRLPLGIFAGGISYPMYLNHWMGAFVAHGIVKRVDFLPPLAEGLLSYFGGVLAGITAYLIVDRIVMASRDAYYFPALGYSLGVAAYFLVSCGLTVGTP